MCRQAPERFRHVAYVSWLYEGGLMSDMERLHQLLTSWNLPHEISAGPWIRRDVAQEITMDPRGDSEDDESPIYGYYTISFGFDKNGKFINVGTTE